ncbi:T9SS type A sorting domain-containing protein [Edaphocola aurantiacus]|uniref:T9SS type A sorting domain-containing protein n=1 Tax=Edaphocola aurantiacus TaxID=2601682 RepID=UPI001C97C586|nr:T9SS type A sorting domain-containing protein [Edaphocola aurantiacus]
MKRIYSLVLLALAGNAGFAQVSMTATNSYTQAFNTLPASSNGTWADNSTISSWYAQRTGNGTSIMVSDGGLNSGGLYSYGTTSNSDRALGSLGSGNAAAGDFAYGVLLRNNSTQTITNITVAYTGEQWRNAASAGAQTVSFYYKTASGVINDLQPTTTSGWTAVSALNFTSPQTNGPSANNTANAINGNTAANRTVISATALTGLSLAPGQYIMLKWDDPDHSGNDHGLSIDDVTINWTVPAATNPIGTAPFRSKASGDYNTAATWQYLSVTTPPTWSDATQKPGSGNVVTIQSAHTVTMTADESADTLKVDGVLVAADHVLATTKPVILNGSVKSTNEYGLSGSTISTFRMSDVTINNASTIEYNATVTQFISDMTYNNLVISGGEKQLPGNVTVNGTVSLGGILHTTATELLQLGNDAQITGGSATAYIDGPVAKSSNTVTTFTLPVGKAGVYRPVIIKPVSTAATTYTAEYFNAGYGNTTVSGRLDAVTNSEYWNINRSGTADANVTLTWGSSSNVINPADVRLAHFNSTANAWEPLGETVTGTASDGTVTAFGVAAFSPFTIGSSSVPLPVQLTAFEGYAQQGNNILNWSTAMEQNNRGFDIMHATDGKNFSKIGFVSSLATEGNSHAALAYQFIHKHAGAAKHYYKLVQTDFDGSSKTSGIVLINNTSATQISVYPNPSGQDNITINLGTDAMATIIVTDLSGKELIRSKATDKVYNLDVSALTAGNYIIRIEAGTVQTVKFVKL